MTLSEPAKRKWIGITAVAVSTALTAVAFYLLMAPSGPMLGVPDDHLEVAEAAYATLPEPFMVAGEAAGQDNSAKNVRLWEVVRQVALIGKPLGQDLGCGPQQTGDCVSWGICCARNTRLCIQVFKGEANGNSAVSFPPYDYGIARRHADQMGLRMLPCDRYGGAYPSVAAIGTKTWGFLTVSDNPPQYSGSLARTWGCNGVPENFRTIGRQRAGGDVYPIRSVEELRDAICNSFPCTIATRFSPGDRYTIDGRGCLRWNGPMLGGHQMCVTGYDGSLGVGHEYFFIQNSHGPNASASAPPQQGEPRGGFWIPLSLARQWLVKGECWAMSDVAGFPAEDKIDWSLFDQFKVQAMQKEIKDAVPNGPVDNRRAERGTGRLLAL